MQTIGVYAGSISFLIHIGQALFRLINHKSCRSRCCKQDFHLSLDVDDTTPKLKQLHKNLIEHNPMVHANTMPNLNLHT